MQTWSIDAWNQAGFKEVSITARSAATGHERNDADIKLAVFRSVSSGFKAGQSKAGGLGYEREVSQTLNAHMSGTEPTMLKCLTPSHPQTHRVYATDAAFPSLVSNSGAVQNQQSILNQNKTMNSDTNTQCPDASAQSEASIPRLRAKVRRLIPIECCRLQGIPDGHPFIFGEETPDSEVYKMQGNGWARNCSRLVLKNMHRVDAKNRGESVRPWKFGTVSSGQGTHELSVIDFGDKAVFCADIAPFPCKLLATRWPETPNFGDVTRISYDAEKKVIHNRKPAGYELMSEEQLGFKPVDAPEIEIPLSYGELDCISGGLPCTSVSIAGKRNGAAEGSGTRSALAYNLPRIGKESGARWLMYENVPGLFSSNGGTDFLWFLYRLQEAGYSVAWRTYDAQFVRGDLHPRAVPQRRRRIYLVAHRGSDWRIPAEVLFEPMKALGSEPPVRTVGKGFLTANPDYDPSVPVPTAYQDLAEFLGWANPDIIRILVDKGICDDPKKLLAELKKADESSTHDSSCDLFGGDLFGAPEMKRQGANLHATDLALDFPPSPTIRSVPQYALFQWAKTVCSEIGYCGEMFKCHDGEPTVDDLDPRPLANIGNAGILSDGIIVTMKTPEWNAGVTEEELSGMPPELAALYDGDVCGLSDILEPETDPNYKLSWRACWGICNRAKNRGKRLPVELGYALIERIVDQARFIKWTALNGRDTKKKETDRTEREIARLCYDDFVSFLIPFDECPSEQPTRSSAEEEPEESEDGENNEAEE